LLRHLPDTQRSQLTNIFLAQVRAGAHHPTIVLKMVEGTLRQRLRLSLISHKPSEPNTYTGWLALLRDHPDEAMAFAAWAINRESLTTQEKAHIKAETSRPFVAEYMAQYPPTDKQLNFLRSLGVATAPANRLEASQLIDHRVQGRGRHG
jgi:hypothetical protein